MSAAGHDMEATIERLMPTLSQVFKGLRDGLKIASRVHAQFSWNPKVDLHLFHHLARRQALEHLRAEHEFLDEDENLGLPMSGLLVRPTPRDVLRVWYSEDARMKAPESESARHFVTQESSEPDLFDLFEAEFNEPNPAVCKTFIRWAAEGSNLTRFELVRPLRIQNRAVVPDWYVDLLDNFKSDPDDFIDDGDDP